jgi:hypothetical protein
MLLRLTACNLTGLQAYCKPLKTFKMKQSTLFMNLMYVLLTAMAMFLIGLTFTAGLDEARQVKSAQVQRH